MILYEYICTRCNLRFEKTMELSKRDAPCSEPCPRCLEMSIERPTRCAGFILKGHCWSRDNYTTHVGDDPRYKAGKWNQNELE